MAYNLIITKRAEELLDDLIYQLINISVKILLNDY